MPMPKSITLLILTRPLSFGEYSGFFTSIQKRLNGNLRFFLRAHVNEFSRLHPFTKYLQLINSAKIQSYICSMKILMVCLGNICRSPLAEGILQQKANDAGLQWQVQSAGTNHYHIGSPPHALSQKVALLNGIDISNQQARRISKEDMEQYDIVYALASDVLEDIKKVTGNSFRNEKVKLFMDEHPMATFKDVPDPWYGAEDGYHEVFKLINEVCDYIVQQYKSTTT